MSLGQQDTMVLLDHVYIWLPFCMTELQLASADGTVDCVYRQWFLEVFLGPFSNVNDRIMPMSDAVSSEGPKTTGIQKRLESICLSLLLRDSTCLMVHFHCMVQHGWVRFGLVRFGSVVCLFFSLGTVPGTWYFFQYHLGWGSKRTVPLTKCDV